jgi:ubiquinone/menaquinone biosynthesis C-methylase UbiE
MSQGALAASLVALLFLAQIRPPDVMYLPTDDAVVDAMLKLAHTSKTDVVYDLGSGDGRIVIAAAKRFGARGVGIDIDPALVQKATENARQAGVSARVRFLQGDIFDPRVSIKDATIVALFLLPDLNLKLRPRLQRELRPGTRVVSNSFDMGPDWPPDQSQQIGKFAIYLWTIRPVR